MAVKINDIMLFDPKGLQNQLFIQNPIEARIQFALDPLHLNKTVVKSRLILASIVQPNEASNRIFATAMEHNQPNDHR